MNKIYIVGIGPGSSDYLTKKAIENSKFAIEESGIIAEAINCPINFVLAFKGLISSTTPVNTIIKLLIKIEFIIAECVPKHIYPNKKPR